MIHEADFYTYIKADVLDRVIEQNPMFLEEAILAAKEEIDSYISGSYETALLFANPSKHFKMLWIDITLYHLHSRISPRQIPELRGIRYDNAIDFLKRVGEGKLNPDYPAKQLNENEENNTLTTIKSKHKSKDLEF
jgi:phage gp36-like protein